MAFIIAFVNTCTKCKLEVGSVLCDSSQMAHQVWVWCWACLAQLSAAWVLGLSPGWTGHCAHGQPSSRRMHVAPSQGTYLDGSQRPARAHRSLGQVISLWSLPSPASALLLHPYFIFPSPQDVFLASVPSLYCMQTSCPER